MEFHEAPTRGQPKPPNSDNTSQIESDTRHQHHGRMCKFSLELPQQAPRFGRLEPNSRPRRALRSLILVRTSICLKSAHTTGRESHGTPFFDPHFHTHTRAIRKSRQSRGIWAAEASHAPDTTAQPRTEKKTTLSKRGPNAHSQQHHKKHPSRAKTHLIHPETLPHTPPNHNYNYSCSYSYSYSYSYSCNYNYDYDYSYNYNYSYTYNYSCYYY